jgi:hypothetical protein
MKKFITAVLCLGLLFSASNGYSVLPSQEDNKWWNINIPKIEITDGMRWAGLGIATYAAYRTIATGFGGLGTLLVNGIGHCGLGVLGIGTGFAAHPYIFIPAGIIVGGIAALDYYSDAAMFNKMKSSWKYLCGASN